MTWRQVGRNLRRLQRRLSGSQRKVLITYVIVATSAVAVMSIEPRPQNPPGYNTLIWAAALMFPLLAVMYNVARLRVRQNEIIDTYRHDELWRVYFRGRDADLEFEDFLQNRLAEHYSVMEFTGFSLLAASLTFVGLRLLAVQFQMPADALTAWDLTGPVWATLAGSSFLGSYSGGIVVLLRRYRQFDLRPPAFLQVAVVLIAGTASGAFISLVYPASQLGALAFVIGFLAAINVRFLASLMRTQFAKLTGTNVPPPIATDLSPVVQNSEAIESLHRQSIFSIQELANADPIRLYFTMPQQIEVLHGMIDRALLWFYFRGMGPELNQVGVQRFTQLLVASVAEFDLDHPRMRDPKLFADPAKNALLRRSIDGILRTGVHHRVLGLLLHPYRDACFPANHEDGKANVIAAVPAAPAQAVPAP